jgi:hypothetical protein
MALSGRYKGEPGDPAPRHGLRQLAYVSSEGLSIYPSRLATNRGNAYLAPGALNGFSAATNGIFPNFDCKNTDYTPTSQDPDEQQILAGQSVPDVNDGDPPGTTPTQFAPCFIQGPFPRSALGGFGDGRFPQVFADP